MKAITQQDAYPLLWPIGYKRTANRKFSPFKQTMDAAQKFLRNEIHRLGGRQLVVSTNLPVRQDGLLYADWMNRKIDDPGVAIYFKYQGKDVSMCCDQYARVWENIYALAKGIEALRGIERWGISDFLEHAFTGFKAIPETIVTPYVSWWSVLEVDSGSDGETIRKAYRKLAAKYHPDNIETGNAEKFIQVQRAYEQANPVTA